MPMSISLRPWLEGNIFDVMPDAFDNTLVHFFKASGLMIWFCMHSIITGPEQKAWRGQVYQSQISLLVFCAWPGLVVSFADINHPPHLSHVTRQHLSILVGDRSLFCQQEGEGAARFAFLPSCSCPFHYFYSRDNKILFLKSPTTLSVPFHKQRQLVSREKENSEV